MSFLKKVASFFFEETEEDVIVEDEIKPIEIKKKQDVVNEEYIEPVKQKQVVQPVMKKAESQHTAVKKDTSKTEDRKFVKIDIAAQQPQVKVKAESVKNTRKQITVDKAPRKDVKTDYEFTPVISPIFGAREEEKKVKPAKKTYVNMPNAQKAAKKNPLGTIISPYFGLDELEEFEEEAQQVIEEKEQVCKEENIALAQEQRKEKETVKSLSLADMLVGDDRTQDSEDDLMQISLFGENTSVRDLEKEKVM